MRSRISIHILALILVVCGGVRGASAQASTSQNSISLALSADALAVTQESTGDVSVTVTRTGTAGKVKLNVVGLPKGASAAYQQPGTGTTGRITISPRQVFSGSYPLTVEANDGKHSATATLNLKVQVKPAISGPYHWSSTGPLIAPISDPTHNNLSIKDPTVVYYNNRWHVFATTASTSKVWSMVYMNFADWSQAATAPQYYMNNTPGYGNKAAPEVFYFRPHKKWYLISEWGPQYSTNDDISNPQGWTKPQDFFAKKPAGVGNWIDYWVNCDEKNCYLFFTNDAGSFFRSKTSIQDFPKGFDTPVLVMKADRGFDLFEASNTYKIKGTNQYLTLIEGISTDDGKRFFRAFVADRLDGDWVEVPGAGSWDTPFMADKNVTFEAGVTPWTKDFSHGEMIRDGYDETLTIDPKNMQFLYQGLDTNQRKVDYILQPWRLGIVRQTSK